MLYMFLAMTAAAGGMAGMAACRPGRRSMLMLSDPTLAFVFALVLIGYSIWDLDQLSGRRYSLASARVSLAEVRAGVPAMAGAESATSTAFSGPIPADADLEARHRTPPPDQAPSEAMQSPATPPPSAEATSPAVPSASSCCRPRSRSRAG